MNKLLIVFVLGISIFQTSANSEFTNWVFTFNSDWTSTDFTDLVIVAEGADLLHPTHVFDLTAEVVHKGYTGFVDWNYPKIDVYYRTPSGSNIPAVSNPFDCKTGTCEFDVLANIPTFSHWIFDFSSDWNDQNSAYDELIIVKAYGDPVKDVFSNYNLTDKAKGYGGYVDWVNAAIDVYYRNADGANTPASHNTYACPHICLFDVIAEKPVESSYIY